MDAPGALLERGPATPGESRKLAELLGIPVPGPRPHAAVLPLFVPQRRRTGGMKGGGAMKPSSMFYVHEADVVQIHHFLEECSLCTKSLSGDIFMYRGDTPFCSEECRQQQIEVDRAKHRRKKRAAAHALTARSREHRHHHHHHHHQQPQPRKANHHPWVDAGFARAPALRV
ncbi:uncharacterized protein [Miscanthus floridulus]|uniref:uncharacterized protein n=1 Tax=Miscanthus floridulus TaxID=154761 RepID=UPI0034583881